MSKPKTLLEDLCEHALSCGAQSIEVEYKDGREWVFARKGETAFGTANFASSSRDAKELRENLYAARKKPVRTAIGGRVWILKVGVYDSFGEDAFRVRIDPAPQLDRSVAPPFTKKQGQYLAFIYNYSKIHGRAPAESDLQRYLQTTPPSVHQMIKTLELSGFVERTPGQARSIRLLVHPDHLPPLS
ncbi:MAG: LexA family protein [Bryobacteraceae bacterium]